MMLLPSGHSNSIIPPLQPSHNPQYVNRTSTPPLSISNRKTKNGGFIQPKSPASTSTASTPALFTQSTILSTSPGAQSEKDIRQENSNDYISLFSKHSLSADDTIGSSKKALLNNVGNWIQIDNHLQLIQHNLKHGWSVHLGEEGRLYYCNHLTQTAGFLPSSEDWIKNETLPYGWERAIDSRGRPYFLNHLNKTSTYEAPESIRWDANPPQPRIVILQRSSSMGFGFVAGSERPVIVRFVTEGGPSINKLQPGDQILEVNGEDVKEAPRDHVIQLVRACESEATLLVCQPVYNLAPGRKSTLLSAHKRAKLRSRPSRVRFAESVCVNGAPLFPPSAFSLGDICVPPMANVLKVFLENGQTKSFKYDATTSVKDVVESLLDKLCLSTPEIFSLVLEHVKSLKRNKLTLLDPEESLARIAARPGAHKLRCLFRITFVPTSAAELAQKDLYTFDYLYSQCCNDVTQERFAPELQPEVALRLAALHMHQHALANNLSPSKLTVKMIEREFGLERFVPVTLFEGMKRKELRRLVSHFLKLNAEMTGSTTKILTQLQAKLHYLDIIASLPSYGAKCFSTNQKEGVERVLLISPRFGLSQISSVRNSVPQLISSIDNFNNVFITRDDDITYTVSIYLRDDRVVKFSMEDRDACEFSLVLAGYFKLLTGKKLAVHCDREEYNEDNAPSYLTQHTVLPAAWSYLPLLHKRAHSVNFLTPPYYHPFKTNQKYKEEFNNEQMNLDKGDPKQYHRSNIMDLDMHSVMATELLEEAKDSGLSDSSGGGSNYFNQNVVSTVSDNALIETKNEEVLRRVQEMQKIVEYSEKYLSEQDELFQEFEVGHRNNEKKSMRSGISTWLSDDAIVNAGNIIAGAAIELDSDCDSLNSSKMSSTEEATNGAGVLKHSDSLVLLAEAINQDLNGITKGLSSIEGEDLKNIESQAQILVKSVSPQSEPRLSFGQMLSNLQVLSTDFSQSESDSESINSPTSSPIYRRPLLLQADNSTTRKSNASFRSSFGLHSPDGVSLGPETKDYNLKEYLNQLKEMSNVTSSNQDTNIAAKNLSKIYGFEIRDDTFIETDSDLIDLRSIPPPQTPDELDALTILNAAPKGFDDSLEKRINSSEVDSELDKFLAKVVVGPPIQKATPAKELTPEEIMSFIIPPPPDLNVVERENPEINYQQIKCRKEHNENLYSNTISEKSGINHHMIDHCINESEKNFGSGHVIEYSTVERKGKFSCCSKSKDITIKEISDDSNQNVFLINNPNLTLPPRFESIVLSPPARPPKSNELLKRYYPKKDISSFPISEERDLTILEHIMKEERPPLIPPRNNTTFRSKDTNISSTVSVAPEKPPLTPHAHRPHFCNLPNMSQPLNGETAQSSFQKNPFQFSSIRNDFIELSQKSSSYNNGHFRSKSDCPFVCLNSTNPQRKTQLSLLCSPQMSRKTFHPLPAIKNDIKTVKYSEKPIVKNGHIFDGGALLAKTDVAMAGLLVKLDQIATQCSAAQSAGGGSSINEEKFQRVRNELTEQTLLLVTASKYLVVSMSDQALTSLPEHLTSCLTAIRHITELTQDMTRHTSSPLQTRNIVLKVHDVTSTFREMVAVQIGPQGAGKLALQAECLANVLATLLRSLRIFSP